MQTVAGHLSAGQGAIPEAVEHQRVRRLALGGFRSAGFEFGRFESLAHEESQAAYYSREGFCRTGLKVRWRSNFPFRDQVYCLVPAPPSPFRLQNLENAEVKL